MGQLLLWPPVPPPPMSLPPLLEVRFTWPSIWSYTLLESISICELLWVQIGQTILVSTCPSSSMAPCQLRLMGYGCASAMEKSRTRKFGDRMAHCHNRPQPTDGDCSIKCIHWHNRPHTTDFSTKCLGMQWKAVIFISVPIHDTVW